MKLPQYIRVGSWANNNCFRRINENTYYRDGGAYEINVRTLGDKIFVTSPQSWSKLKVEEVSKESWHESNGQYVHDIDKYEDYVK